MLNAHDPRVAKLLADLDEDIESYRNGLERPGKTAQQYDVLRGQLKATRTIKDRLTNEDDDPNV